MSKKKELSPKEESLQNLVKFVIENYQPTSTAEIQDIFKNLFKSTFENMMKGELDSELGYEKNDQSPKETTNRRNGSYKKTVQSTLGEIELNIPRDRDGVYEPKLVEKGQRDISGLEEKVIAMYGKGTSDRDISDVVNDIYGFKVSPETISNIVERIQPKVIEWQNRTLEKVYPFVYMDCLMISVKGEKKSGKHACYTIIAINSEGKKDCLGFWMSENEGANFWLSIFDELKSRGVEKLGFVCIDGLKGMEESITSTFHDAIVCRCMVHLIRNSTKYLATTERKDFCTDLKAIYGAVSITAAETALNNLNDKWGAKHPSACRVWNSNFEYVRRLFEYPSEIRRLIYTTNTIESFNSQLRKVTNRKGAFYSTSSVMRILYLCTSDIMKKWTMPVPNWGKIREKLDILWGDNWTLEN